MNILESLKDKLLVADGAFGTCYVGMYGEQGTVAPELANMRHPERVLEIHKEYVKAGAGLIRTNTFAANTASLDADMDYVISNVRAAVKLAKQAAKEDVEAADCVRMSDAVVTEADESGTYRKKVYVAGDIGPIPADAGLTLNERVSQYKLLGEAMQDMGVDIIWFETFPEFNVLESVVKHLKARKDTPVMVSFCVNQFGYSNCGFSARALLSQVAANTDVDCVGFNCGVGPYHMLQLLKKLDIDCGKPVSIMPNAGYPKFTQSRLVFNDNKEGFIDKIQDIAALGADIIGGCCGTNPEYIHQITERVENGDIAKATKVHVEKQQSDNAPKDNFLKGRLARGGADAKNFGGHKLIAVELAPPVDVNDQKLLDAAHILKQSHVDVVTFPDSPSGRTRADSILMAEKVHKETGLRVMPHLCCRDKNAIAIRGSVLGAQLNGIKDFLVITGDPVPVMFRQTTRSVFNFDSVGMMKLLQSMNEEVFGGDKITYGGAINQNRLNTKFEIDRIKRKMEAGAEFFLTQPVFSRAQAQILRDMKAETGATILVGIMPLVSRRNALFMKNEMAGIEIPDEIIERYGENATRQEGEDCGIQIAREILGYTVDFADGYYFSFPFNRVHMLAHIVD